MTTLSGVATKRWQGLSFAFGTYYIILKNKLLEMLKFSRETDKKNKVCLSSKLQTKFVVSFYLHYLFLFFISKDSLKVN